MSDLERIVTGKGRKFLLRVETSHEAQDYQKYEDIRNEIWGFPDDHLAGTRNMMCENFLAEGGSLFIGAFVENPDGGFPTDAAHLAGFCYGFVGIVDKEVGFRNPANLRFYSQFAGVRPEYQSCGLGVVIKEFQRDVVRGRFGLGRMICTYDPLTGVNAHRNVHHFGMEVVEYRVATYGEYGGLLNRSDVASDRFLMSWDLAKPARDNKPPSASASREAEWALRVENRRVKGQTSESDLEVVLGSNLGCGKDVFLVPIPHDFYRMLRETDVDDPEVRRIPVDWRLHTRSAFLELFGQGYKVVDFVRAVGRQARSGYVLQKSKREETSS
jgi:predicted GNAT superfamily acetyltransferase